MNADQKEPNWQQAIERAASVWSDAMFPSEASKSRTHRALMKFADNLPKDATVKDLRKALRKWKISR